MTNLTLAQIEDVEFLKEIVLNTPDQIFIVTASGIILGIYPGSERMFDVDYSQVVGKHYRESFATRFCDLVEKIFKDVIKSNCAQSVTYSTTPREIYAFENPDFPDEVFWFEARVTPLKLKNFDETIIMWDSRDVTKKVRLEEEINLLINNDDLTGIFNRRRFMAYLSDSFSQFKRYQCNTCIVMLDIDDFKKCNDNLGHLTGDKVIQHVAKVCSGELRESDIFGRLGGEEFAIILSQTNLEQGSHLAERLRLIIENTPCQLQDDKLINVTVSIGISQFEPFDAKENMVLSRADKAMYSAKRQGKNRVAIFNG